MDQSSQPMDLLSAALNESGVTEEFEEFDTSGFDLSAFGAINQQTPTAQNQYSSASVIQQQNVQFGSQNPAFSATPVSTSHVSTPLRIVQQGGVVRALQPGGVIRTPTQGAGVRRVIIRTPQNQQVPQRTMLAQRTASPIRIPVPASTMRPQVVQPGVNRVLTMTPGRSSPVLTTPVQQQAVVGAKPGPVRIIKIAKSDQTTTAAPNTGQPKILKIVRTSSASVPSSGGGVKRIVVQARNNPSSIAVPNVLTPAGSGHPSQVDPNVTFIRPPGQSLQTMSTLSQAGLVSGATMRNAAIGTTVKMSPHGVPVQALKNLPPANRKIISNMGKNVVLRVKTDTDTGSSASNRFKSSIRTYSKQSPVRTTGNATSATATISASNEGTPKNTNASNSQISLPASQSVVSQPCVNNVAKAQAQSITNVANQPFTCAIANQTISTGSMTVLSQSKASTVLSPVVQTYQQNVTSAVNVEPRPSIAAEDAIPSQPAAPSFDEVMKMEEVRMKKLSDKTAQETVKSYSPSLDSVKSELVKSEIIKSEKSESDDLKMEPLPEADIKFDDIKFDNMDTDDNAEWLKVKRELEANLFKSEPMDFELEDKKIAVSTQDSKSELSRELKTESEIKQEPLFESGSKSGYESHVKQALPTDTIKQEFATQIKSESSQGLIKNEASIANSSALAKPAQSVSVSSTKTRDAGDEKSDVIKPSNVTVTNQAEKPDSSGGASQETSQDSDSFGGFGDFGGGDFFQALAQLQDTNKKAKEFEEKVKSHGDTTLDDTTPTSTTLTSTQPSHSTSASVTMRESKTGSDIQTIEMHSTSVPTPAGIVGAPIPNTSFSTNLSQHVISNTPRTLTQMRPFAPSTGGSLVSIPGIVGQSMGPPRMVIAPSQIRMTSPHIVNPPRGVALVSPMDDDAGITHAPVRVTGATNLITSQMSPNIAQSRVQTTSIIAQPGRVSSPFTVHRPLVAGRSGSPLTVMQRVNSPNQLIRVVSNTQPGQAPTTRFITVPGSSPHVSPAPQRIQVVSRPDQPVRSLHNTPRLMHNESTPNFQSARSQFATVTRRVIGPDGTPRLVAVQEKAPPPPPPPVALTDKDVSRIWANEEIKLRSIQSEPNFVRSASPGVSMFGRPVIEEEVEEEEQELGIAETYADYMPSKTKVGVKHPDTVVETSSLSSVESPDVHYKLHIPEHIMDYGHLSALQLETIIYSSQKHHTFLPSGQRAGFLVGDGAGVGKGRTIAGIIYENYLQGRKRSLWLSVSNDLRVDAERDLRDIGASKIEVHPLNKFKYAKISSSINGKVKKGVIFSTYSALIGESSAGGKYRTRFKQLIHWLGKDFDGLLVFDECHRAKNLCPVGSSKPTKTGLTVLELQNKLPKARVIYASATGASEPRNMAYMTRLGLWGEGTPFPQFTDFIQAVEKRGVGAMELVAMDMKLRGTYIARQLSFHGVQFKVETVPVDERFRAIYNHSVTLWVDAREKFCKAIDLMGAEQRSCKTMWGQFWSAHQRFFKYLCISAKVDHCVKLARDAIKSGKCVVIGLQSTGEARTQEALEEFGEINDFVSTAKGVFQSMVERHFPAPNRRKTFDLLSLFEDDVPGSPKRGNKRKKTFAEMCDVKRRREDWSEDSGNDSDDDKDNTKTTKKKPNKKPNKAKSPASGSDASSSDDENEKDSDEDDAKSESDKSSAESEPEDFNPFGGGSDSDDDPWLKRSKAKKAKKETKKKKDKKNGMNGKEKKKKKKRSRKENSDDDNNFDDNFDKMLMASGLKTPTDPGSMPALAVGADDADKASELRQELLVKIERLGEKLPPNTLDQLIDDLGGPDNVAEMTGRKGRVVSTENGSVHYESRSESDIPLEILNLAEKQRFMDGEKFIAVISEAASSGISLQADRRANNQRRRVHITLELPWSADRAIQQFGRTHRSNQVSAPQYIFLISELAGERRFASTVSKRLESLGALTHGDRRATETRDLSQFNIDNKYGKTALEAVMKSIAGHESSLVPPPSAYSGNFFSDARQALVGVGLILYNEKWGGCASLEKDYNNISKFLNRLLGTEVELQNALFQYFTDTLSFICLQAKRNGRWDMGILDLGSSGEKVKLLSTKSFVGSFSGTATKVQMHTVSVERGMSYNEAMRIWHEHSAAEDGFYVSSEEKQGRRGVLLAVMLSGKRSKTQQLYNVYKPNSGLQGKPEALKSIKAKYRKALPDAARRFWEDQHTASATMCSHAYWKGVCRKSMMNRSCEVGLRSRTYYVLSGSVLSVWNTVERVLMSTPGNFASRMQVIRLRTDDGKRIVGTLIPANALQSLEVILSQAEQTRVYNTQHAMGAEEGSHAALGLLGNQAAIPSNRSSFSNLHGMLSNQGNVTSNQYRVLNSQTNVVSNRNNVLSNQAGFHTNQTQLHSSQGSLLSNQNSHLGSLSSLVNRQSSISSLATSLSNSNQGFRNASVIEEKTEQQYINMPKFF